MSGRLHAQSAASAPPDADVATAPVTIDGVELFRLRGVSSFPADRRAREVTERIRAVAADPAVPSSSVTSADAGNLERITAGGHPLLLIVDADANLEGVSRAELAQTHVLRIRQAIDAYRGARTRAALMDAATRTAIATLVLAVAVWLLRWFWRWFDRLLVRRVQARIKSVGIQSFEVLGADRIRTALESAVSGVRAVVFLVCALVYVGYVLTNWPWTRGLSPGIAGFVLDPLRTMVQGLMGTIPQLMFLAVLVVVLRLVLRLIRLFFESVSRRAVTLEGFDADWALPTYKLVRIAVVALGLVVAYPYIPGSQSDAFKGVSLFIGVVFSLGSSSAISNMIAGYMITYRRAFHVGDRVKIGDSIGEVIETRLQVTHLRSIKNEEIVIPNSQILNGEVLNYSSLSRERGLLLHTEVGIGYETPWRQVEAMLLQAAARTPGLGPRPDPFVLIKKLADFAVVYELNAPCGDLTAINATYTALHKSVLDVFNEYGIQIMTPAYEGDPEEPKIVAPKDWYAAPAPAPPPRP